MKVWIKTMAVEMEVKTKGVELTVYGADGKKQLGDLVVTKTGLIWCKGKTTPQYGVKVSWEKFIEWMES